MKIFLGSDHAGFDLKNKIFAYLTKKEYDVEDIGAKQLDAKDDYPQFAYEATTKVIGSTDGDPRAILVCGSGQGMAMAANRIGGIRAAVVWDDEVAKETREDNDSNVLSLPARSLDEEQAISIIETWLQTEFSNAPRHKRRIDEIDDIYG